MIIIESILIAYFLYVVSYSLFFSVGGLFYKSKETINESENLFRFAVLIPGYKEDQVIVDTVKQNLKVNYPDTHFDLIVIADTFSESTLDQLHQLPIKVNEVEFEKSTKVKSLKATIKTLEDCFDYIVILDADNIMDTEFLSKINAYLNLNQQTAKAVQTQRWPKNSNTTLAVLDGISESINNHIYRQGADATGFSVSLSGSGMVFERRLFERLILQMESVGGFDRELEFRFLEEGVKVQYFREAKVFDQKTDNHGNFQNQRKRWISSQYVYLAKYFRKGLFALLKGNIVYFHSTVWRNIQLPRLINLGMLTMLTILAIAFQDFLYWHPVIWATLWSANTLAIFLGIPKSLYNKDLLLSILMLPKIFASMFLMMFKLKGANKKFIHTEHKVIS